MNNCRLHPSLLNYFQADIQFKICAAHLLVSYCESNGNGIEMPGIRIAATSRLRHPELLLFFFSFLPLNMLRQKDEFGILTLPGTIFLRLPFEKKQFHNLLKKKQNELLTIESDQWKTFSKTACKILLKRSISEIKHGNENDLGKAILPLRAAATMVINSPENSSFKKAYLSALVACKSYIRSSKIQEMTEWANLCKNSTDPFLNNVVVLFMKLREIQDCTAYENRNEIKKMIHDIDQLKGILKTL